MINKTFLKGTVILTIATLASKIIGSIFRIPLQNIAGDEVLGIFSLVYPVYMVALILSVAGIPIAISQLISKARIERDEQGIFKIYKTAVWLTLTFGVLSFSLITLFSQGLANILGGQSSRLALIVVSSTLLVAPYMAVYRGYFQGFEDMRPTAISQVLEQLIRVSCILLFAMAFVKLQYSDSVIAGAVMIGSIIGAIASTVYLRRTFKASLLRPDFTRYSYKWVDFTSTAKKILALSLPICVGAITMALLNFVDSITIPFSLREIQTPQSIHYQYGIYSRGLSLVQIATVFSSAVVLPLIPLLTKTLAKQNTEQAGGIVEKVHSVTHLISWPIAIGMAALVLPINLALFTNTEGTSILFIFGLSTVFTSLSIVGTGVLQGIGQAKQAAYLILLAVLLKCVTNVFFVQTFGLIGAAYSTTFVYLVIFIGNTILIYRRIPFHYWKSSTTLILISSLLMGLVLGVGTITVYVQEWSRIQALSYTVIATFMGIILYFLLLKWTKAFDIELIKLIKKRRL